MIILLVPAMSIFTVFVFWPILRTIYLSFFDWNMISRNKKFVMLDNYTGILTDPVIYKSLGNTFLYIIFLGIFNFILPYIFAYALALLISKLKNFYRAMIFFPSIISLVVASLIFLWLFNPMSGPISKVYEIFGIESPFWLKTNGL